MRFALCGALLAATFIGGVAFATTSRASGLTSLHEHVQIGDRVCMVDHDHHGQSGAWATKEEAVAAATRSWAGFTGLEYGRDWADLRIANNQEMKCGQVESPRGLLWQCTVKATPCSPARAPAYRHAMARRAPVSHAPAVHAPVAQSPAPAIVSIRMHARRDVRQTVPHRHDAYCGHGHARVHALYHGRSGQRDLVWPGDRR